VVDHAKLQSSDDIAAIDRVRRRVGKSFSHCVPRNIANTDRGRLISRQARRAIGPTLQDQP
jgi:hypothetical protein